MSNKILGFLLVVGSVLAIAVAAYAKEPDDSDTWLAAAEKEAAKETKVEAVGAERPAGQPVSVRHTIEGVGGGWFVPNAYLVNPGPKDQIFGLPAASATFIGWAGSKNVLSFAVSETFFGRLEFSYSASRMYLDDLPRVIYKTVGNKIRQSEICLHNFNLRGLLVEEDSFGLPLPALTAGLHFKYNPSIERINGRLGIPLDAIGYERSNGLEFTVTATKTVHLKPLPRVVATVGMRNSDASNLGYMGFGDHRNTTVEVGVEVYPVDWLVVSYEFRRKERAFSAPPVSGMLRGEENWHGLGVGVLLNDHLSLNVGVLFLGNIGNTKDAVTPSFQVKYEF